jgi:hypothetical protein
MRPTDDSFQLMMTCCFWQVCLPIARIGHWSVAGSTMDRAVAIFLRIPFFTRRALRWWIDRRKGLKYIVLLLYIFFVNSKYLVYFRYSMDLSVAGNFVYWLECGEKKWGVHFSSPFFVTLFRCGHHFPKIYPPYPTNR